MVMLMKHTGSQHLISVISGLKSLIKDILQAGAKDYIISSVYYVMSMADETCHQVDDIVEVMTTIEPEIGGKAMTIAESLRAQGRQEGEQRLAKSLLENGVAADVIAKAAGMDADELFDLVSETQS